MISHHQAAVGGAAGSGEVTEQAEVPPQGDEARADRHHRLHHLLAPALGHADRTHQVSSYNTLHTTYH